MKYVSLDLETTGLDPYNCDVLHMALIVDDWPAWKQREIQGLPFFEGLVRGTLYVGEATALWMNRDIFQALGSLEIPGKAFQGYEVQSADTPPCLMPTLRGRELPAFDSLDQLIAEAVYFLKQHIDGKWVIAGKNVAGFDLQFLPEEFTQRCHHRTIDVGSLALGAKPDQFWADQSVPPSLEKIRGSKALHDALIDAREVVGAIRTLVPEG